MTWGTFQLPRTGTAFKVNRIGFHRARGMSREVPVFDETGLDWFAEEIKRWVNDRMDVPILVTGSPGLGKSQFAINVARRLNPNLSQDDIVYWLEQFVTQLERSPRGIPGVSYPTIIYDESGTGLDAHDHATEGNRGVARLNEIIRMNLLTVFYILPHIKDLDRSLRGTRVVYWAEMVQRGYVEIRAIRRDQFDKNPWMPCLCAIKYPEHIDDFWKAYETRKREFIDQYSATMGARQKLSVRERTQLHNINRLVEYIQESENLTISQVSERSGVPLTFIKSARSRLNLPPE